MKLFNPWKSLFRSSGRSRRRSLPGESPFGHFAADVLEYREMLSAAAPAMTLTVQGNNVTLTSTDINNPNVSITRSGNNIVVAGTNGTQITFGNSVGTTQTIALASVNNLTVNLGTGADTVTIFGLSVAGNIAVNGQSTGTANVTIDAGAPNVVIGGSILANFGGEAATFGLFGSTNGGGSLTVNGAVSVTEGGAGNHQVNLYGPPANNPSGGKLILKGGVSIVDTGSGPSGLRIDDGVTITGNVSFDNSANTVGGDDVEIFSNSIAFGTTSITGALNLSLSHAVYQPNTVIVSGFGSSLVVTGATAITSGNGSDTIRLLNTWFKSTVNVNTGSSPSFSPDTVIVQGARFDGAVAVTMTGAYAALGLGTDAAFAPTVFNSSFAAAMTGASASAFLSNPTSTTNEVIFNSTAAFTGGSPAGSLILQGRFFVNPGKLTRTNFNIVT